MRVECLKVSCAARVPSAQRTDRPVGRGDGEKFDPTSTFSSMSAAESSSQGHTDAHDDERIEVSLRPYVSEEPQHYEEVLRSESRASGADTPSQGGSCHSFYTALSARSRTPSIESGTTAESSLYLQCDGLRLRPITPELLPNEGPDHIRMASSDSEHEEELLSTPYVDSEAYEMRPFSLQKPVLRSFSLSRLNHPSMSVKPKLSVITQLSDPIKPLRPDPAVTIFKKEKPQKGPANPPPEPASEPEEETDAAALKTQTTGTTSSTARTSDTIRLAAAATSTDQFTMFSSLNDSSFRLSPISASIEQAFKKDMRFGSAPVSSRPLVTDYENRKSLMAIPCTPIEYIDDGSHSPPALSPDVTGEHSTFPPISTPPGTADGTSPLPVVTKLQHIIPPPPLPPKDRLATVPAMPESPAIIALEATPAPSAYRAPRNASGPPHSSEKASAAGMNNGSTSSLLSKSSSRESLRSAPPKPAPTISLPPIPVKALSLPIPAKTCALANASSDAPPVLPAKSNVQTSPKASATLEASPAAVPSESASNESPLTTSAAPKTVEHEAPALVKVAPKPLPKPQPRVVNTLPSPPKTKTESQPEPKARTQAEGSKLSPPARKLRSLPPIPVKPEVKEANPVASTLPTPPTRKTTIRRPLPPVPKKKADVTEQLLLSPVPKLPTSPLPTDLPANATNALKKITINTAVVTPIRMSLATTPVDFSADYSPSSSPTTPTANSTGAQGPSLPLFNAFDPSVPSPAWTEYPCAPAAGVEADENRVSFYHAI